MSASLSVIPEADRRLTTPNQTLGRRCTANAVADPVALLFVNQVLSPANESTLGEPAKQLLRGRLVEARCLFVTAGQVLATYFADL